MENRYSNLYPPYHKERPLKDLVKWLSTRSPQKWQFFHDVTPSKTKEERVKPGEVVVTYINHSTALIQVDNLNILTDPIWSAVCGPLNLIGPKRMRIPGMNFEDLPPIDIVLVSHNHYDHMDLPTLKKLREKHRPLICVSRGNRKWLEQIGFSNVFEFDWWQQESIVPGLKLSFVPAQHFARRGVFDRNKTLWGGFYIHSNSGSIYFAGDTGFGSHFTQIHDRLGPPSVALLPIGAYLPRWFMYTVHMSPHDAVQAHQILRSQNSIPIHFGTFQLGDETYTQPLDELSQSLSFLEIPQEKFIALHHGENRRFVIK